MPDDDEHNHGWDPDEPRCPDCGAPTLRGVCTVPTVETNTNSTVDDRERRKDLGCSYCPPNRKENAGRRPKHGEKKPRSR